VRSWSRSLAIIAASLLLHAAPALDPSLVGSWSSTDGHAQGTIRSAAVAPERRADSGLQIALNDGLRFKDAEQWDSAIQAFTTTRLIPEAIFGRLQYVALALKDFDTVIAREPNHAKAVCMRGLCRLETLQFDNAVADFTRAIQLDPRYAFAYCYRGIAAIDRVHDGSADLNRCYALNPNLRPSFERNKRDAMELRHEYRRLQQTLAERYRRAQEWAASQPTPAVHDSYGESVRARSALADRYRSAGDSYNATQVINGGVTTKPPPP
jgi:tetratricopeptide (TPR) repeat protein